MDSNLYIKTEGDDLLIVLVYVDDIIFGCTNNISVQWFAVGTDVKWMWQSTEKEAGTQVSMEKIEQWEVLEIQTKVYGKSTYRIKQCTEKTMKICLNRVKCITLIQGMLSIRRVRDLDPIVIIHFRRSSSEGFFRSSEFESMFFKKHINVKSMNSE